MHGRMRQRGSSWELRVYVGRVRSHARADLSPKTVLETRGRLDRYLLPALGPTRLSQLRSHDLDGYHRELRARGHEAVVRWHRPRSGASTGRLPLDALCP